MNIPVWLLSLCGMLYPLLSKALCAFLLLKNIQKIYLCICTMYSIDPPLH